MGIIGRRILKGVLAIVAWPKVTLGIAGLLLVASILLAVTKLGISTDQNKLFSKDRQFFRDYLSFIEKFPENEALYAVIEKRDPKGIEPSVERWTGLADALADKLRTMPEHVRLVEEKTPLDQLGAQGLLFQSRAQLQQSVQDFRALGHVWGEDPQGLERLALTGNTPLERFYQGVNSKLSLGALSQDETADLAAATFAARLARWYQISPDATTPSVATQPNGEQLLLLARLGAMTPLDLGYAYLPDESDPNTGPDRRHILLVPVYHKEKFSEGLTAISETVDAIRTAVGQVAKQYPEFKVGVTGRPALDADEMRTTDRDTRIAEIIAMSVIFVGLVFMLRSIWLALVAEITLGVGIGWTLGWATLTVGELNLLSLVFVIALIGIGMDYLIQILTRYRREAQRYSRQSAIWARVFRYVSPPINTACLGAAGAFLVSALTDFRGAGDLGIIAGGGLLLCLLAGYTVLPAILILWPAKLKPVPAEERYTMPRTFARFHWFHLGTSKKARMIKAFSMVGFWIVLCLAGIPFMLRTNFDPNLLKMQSPGLESVQLIKKLQTWYAVVLSDDLESLRRARQAVAGGQTITRTESILDASDNGVWLAGKEGQPLLAPLAWKNPTPPTLPDLKNLRTTLLSLAENCRLRAKLPTLASTRQSWLQNASDLDSWAQRLIQIDNIALLQISQKQSLFVSLVQHTLQAIQKLPTVPANGGGVDLDQLPPMMRSHYLSIDPVTHKKTYALYIYPKDNLWNRAPLSAFVNEVETRLATLPKLDFVPLRCTGIAPNIFHSTKAIEQAFYQATAYALILIFLLVLIDLRHLAQTLLAISVLAFGLPMLVAIMGYLDISWNFANFFGLPILIGAGHEYGVFMVHRYREVLHNPRRTWHFGDVSDRALLLCAFVTSSSFAFLMLGDHRGIRSLGLVMALGSACIYLATVLVVRPILLWWLPTPSAPPP